METQTLGKLLFDSTEEIFKSSRIKVPVLKNAECTFVFDELEDEAKEFPKPFEAAVSNFLSLPAGWLDCLTDHLWEYYQDVCDSVDSDDIPSLSKPELLDRIQIGSDVSVTWDCDENDVYVSLESDCDWEIEHGLQITLKNGNQLAKVGPYDGHVTNSDAYDDDAFRDVIYVKQSML